MIHKVYISIGTNKGNKVKNCHLAIKKLRSISKVSEISSFYKTSSWGYKDDFYLKFVVKIYTAFSPNKLLNKLLFIEKEMGRIRETDGYTSRIIDFDILFFNNLVFRDSNLIIPHPQLYFRKFVLIPLLEIAPHFECPQKKTKILDLLRECNDQNSVEKFLFENK